MAMSLCPSSPRCSRRFQALLFGLSILLAAETAAAQIRTVLVSPVPGNPLASGTALRNALAGIPSPSSTDRWLLKVEPGIFDIGAISLPMRSWVDIEGSGIGVTTIRGTVDGSTLVNGTIHGASNAELRLLTVEATGNSSIVTVIAMYNENAFPRLYRVKLVAQASSSVWGIRNFQSAPLIEECEITASTTSSTNTVAYGIVFRDFVSSGQRSSILRSKIAVSNSASNYGLFLIGGQTVNELRDSRLDVTGGGTTYGIYAASPGGWTGQENLNLRNVELSSAGGSSASYGVYFESGSWVGLEIITSKVWGHVSPTTYGIRQLGNAAVVLQGSSVVGFTKTIDSVSNVSIASTLLNGGPVTVTGWLGCMGVWDENGVFYANTCPP
jgi:hypothetical protein